MCKVGVGVLLASLIQLCASLSPAQVAVSSKGETVLSSRFASTVIQVKIKAHELPNGTTDKPVKPPDSGCTMSRIPCSVVDGLEIAVAGKSVFIPRSVFADLADVNDTKLATQKGAYVLLLTGGDASESYIVKIMFNSQRVTYRSLTSGEFPKHPLQETTYRLAD